MAWDSCRRSLTGFMLSSPRDFVLLRRMLNKESPRLEAKAHQHHYPNVISLYLAMVGRRWHVVGCEITTRDASTLDRIVAETGHRYRGTEILVAGDFNTDLESPYGNKRDKAISAAMATKGLDYMM